MREIVVKITIDDSKWKMPGNSRVLMAGILHDEYRSRLEFEVLSDSNDEEPLNVNAMMQLA